MNNYKIDGKNIFGDNHVGKRFVVPDGVRDLRFAILKDLNELPETSWYKVTPTTAVLIKEGPDWNQNALKEIELPLSLSFIGAIWPTSPYPPHFESVYYHGTLLDLSNTEGWRWLMNQSYFWCDCFYILDKDGNWEDFKKAMFGELVIPNEFEKFTERNFYLFECCKSIHLHSHLKSIPIKFAKELAKKTIYFDCPVEEIVNNPVYASLCEQLSKKKISVMVPSSGKDDEYVPTYIGFKKEIEKADENGFIIENDVLIRCDAKGEVIIPEGIKEIVKGAFNKNHKMTKITLPSTLVKFGALNINNKVIEKIEVVYFNGSGEQFDKIVATDASNPYLLSPNIFVKDKNGNYNQIVGLKNLYFKTKGFDESFVNFNKYSFIDEIASFYEAKKEQYPGSFNTLVCFEEGNLSFVFECDRETLGQKTIEFLFNKHILFGCDDFLITRYTNHFYTFYFATKCDLDIQDGILKKCTGKEYYDGRPYLNKDYKPSALLVNLPNDAFTYIDVDAFKDHNGVFLTINVPFIKFLKMYTKLNLNLDINDYNFIGRVFCNDAEAIIWKVNHRKANGALYYSGCHYCCHTSHRALELCKKKQFYAFLSGWPGIIRETNGELSIPDYAYLLYEDGKEDDTAYSVFDYDNFCEIKDIDFEAG